MADYYNQCGSCDYYRFEGEYKKGYCSWYKTYYYPDETCNHYREKSMPTGCFITTMVCDILGMEDDCDSLQTLRSFRDNVMQKDSKFAKMLYQYDVVGPEIAKCLNECYKTTGDKEAVQKLYDSYIVPTCDSVKANDYDAAVKKYTSLVEMLMCCYSIDDSSIITSLEDYDFTTGGHGRCFIKNNK